MSDSQSILCAALLSFLAMTFSAVGLWGRVRSKDIESLKRMLGNLPRQAPQGPHQEFPRVSGLAKTSEIQYVSSLIASLHEEIRSLKDLLKTPPPVSAPVSVFVPDEPAPVVVSPRGFLERLLEEYNSSSQDVFREHFSPKLAQFDGSKSLKLHDAGSFWIVESPTETYCLPRPRTVTPTLHDNVGLKRLFEYAGYSPNGPEPSFRVDEPARVTAGLDGSWVLEQPGKLTMTTEGAG